MKTVEPALAEGTALEARPVEQAAARSSRSSRSGAPRSLGLLIVRSSS